MKIIAKRPFISSRRDIGNVPQGRILDIDDAYANMLIKAGLVEIYSASQPLRADKKSFFVNPIGANAKNGQSSQAGQASQKPTATKSRRGAKKTRNAG
jgi:hypothetical protein